MQISADDAAKKLMELIDAALAGEEVIIVARKDHAVTLQPVPSGKKDKIRVVI